MGKLIDKSGRNLLIRMVGCELCVFKWVMVVIIWYVLKIKIEKFYYLLFILLFRI